MDISQMTPEQLGNLVGLLFVGICVGVLFILIAASEPIMTSAATIFLGIIIVGVMVFRTDITMILPISIMLTAVIMKFWLYSRDQI